METSKREISTTQITNYVSIAGVIVMLAGRFGLELEAEDIATLIGCAVTIYGIVANFVHRARKGDITISGIRK